MTLNDIIRYLDIYMAVALYDNADQHNPTYTGTVFNIPWSYLDLTLAIDDDGEAIYIDDNQLLIYLNM